MRNILTKVLAICMICCLCSCERALEIIEEEELKEMEAQKMKDNVSEDTVYSKIYAKFSVSQKGRPLGEIKLLLYNKAVPETVGNFIGLAEGSKDFINPRTGNTEKKPFYDGLIFHRVIPDFMIQAGDPLGNGRGGPGYRFKDEIVKELKFTKQGLLAMANAGPNTNGSQFFITLAPTPWLDGKHTIFGEVVSGMEIVKKISEVSVGNANRPVDSVVMDKVVIERAK
ncbi:peptidylprolyl isomerase [Elusimicrobiota bacterium]